jgi:pimeloyl-ACP methyl ester carboxylesterase
MDADARRKNSTNVRSNKKLETARTVMKVVQSLSPPLAAVFAERVFTHPARGARTFAEWEALACAQPLALDEAAAPARAWRWGAEEAPTVLLVHGWQGRGTQLHAFIDPLVERGFSVIAFDGPAHGDAAGSSATIADLTRVILSVERAIGPLAGVIAHSLGAAATTWALADGLRVERVAYIAPLVSIAERLDGFGELIGASADVRRRFTRRLEARTGRRISSIEGVAIARARREALLVLHDPADREIPYADAERIVQAWPGARLISATGLGHNRILAAPEAVQETVRFLSDGAPALAPSDPRGFQALHWR